MVNTSITLTLSKILAYLTLFGGIVVAIILEDPMSFAVGVGGASAMIVNKQYQDRVKTKYEADETKS